MLGSRLLRKDWLREGNAEGLIGRILSELSIGGSTEYDIAPFAVDRPVLQMAQPPTNFLLRREARSSDSVVLGS